MFRQFRHVLFVVLALGAAACGKVALDPNVVGGQVGALACLGAVTKEPGSQPVIAAVIPKVLAAIDDPNATQASIDEALAKIRDPKARLLASALVSSALVLFPVGDVTAKLDPKVVDAIKAALAGCQTVVGTPTSTTTTTTTSTTTTTL